MGKRSAKLLSSYILPGPATDPHQGIVQTTEAERIGLGAVWESELQGPMKDAPTILGYLAAITDDIHLGTSITHFGTRHPMILTSWAATMQVLSGNRFEFGFGRSTPPRWRNWGIPIPTVESMEDYANLLRRLWNRETVSYQGPAGNYPNLHLGEFPDFTPPPLLVAAIGPRTLELAGRAFDGVHLHPYLTAEGVAKSRDLVRAAAERAGRDPDAVMIYHQLVSTPDLTGDDYDQAMIARAGAYFSHVGFAEPIFEMNGWNVADLVPLREAVKVAEAENAAKGSPLRGRAILLEPARRHLKEEWIATGGAVGSAADVAKRFHEYFDAGCDRLVVHGVTPDKLEATVRAFEAI